MNNKLSSLQNQVFLASVSNPDISENFSSSLKKAITTAGVASVLAVLMLSSQSAHADNTLRTMLGVSAVTGFLTHNSRAPNTPDECNVRGVSGIAVGGATAAGALLGNQIGKGSGKKWATGILGAAAGTGAYKYQEQRVEQDTAECYRRIAERNARTQPVNAPHNAMSNPENNILYSFTNPNFRNQQQIVTMSNSPGINAIRGARYNHAMLKDPNSDPQVANAIEKAIVGLQNAYGNFERSSERHIALTQTNVNPKSSRYAVGSYEINQAERNLNSNRRELQKASYDWDKAFTSYAQERAFTAAIFDNAAIDGYDLTRYQNLLPLFNIPQVAVQACECAIPNRSSTVPNVITMDRR